MLRRALGETVRIVPALSSDVGNVLADRHQLENALLNLALNARDAMRGDGTLTIAAYNVQSGDASNAGRAPTPPGEYVTLEPPTRAPA